MDKQKLFHEHIQTRQRVTEQILAKTLYKGLIVSSGESSYYFSDDQEVVFRTTPHFAHWCPDQGPQHLLQIRPGKKPRLLRYAPADFWHEHQAFMSDFWTDAFEVEEFDVLGKQLAALGPLHGYAVISPEKVWGTRDGVDWNPYPLTSALDWERGLKTDYEVHCLSEANKKAAKAHIAARSAFAAGASEIEIHHAYMQALACTDKELPYGSIVALDAKSAVLHYQNKRSVRGGEVFLIDAGASVHNYGSDITRTYVKAKAPAAFRSIVAAMEKAQQELCQLVKAEVSYPDLHDQTHKMVAKILLDAEVLKKCSAEDAVEKGLSKAFFPHGLGHMLGIQVHDVSGKQKNAQGDLCEPPKKYPTLRMARALREREVITVEPGLYFIPMLLEPHRTGEHKGHFNFPLIDTLIPCGGIRIEDNVFIGKTSNRNLTREFLGNDFAV